MYNIVRIRITNKSEYYLIYQSIQCNRSLCWVTLNPFGKTPCVSRLNNHRHHYMIYFISHINSSKIKVLIVTSAGQTRVPQVEVYWYETINVCPENAVFIYNFMVVDFIYMTISIIMYNNVYIHIYRRHFSIQFLVWCISLWIYIIYLYFFWNKICLNQNFPYCPLIWNRSKEVMFIELAGTNYECYHCYLFQYTSMHFNCI